MIYKADIDDEYIALVEDQYNALNQMQWLLSPLIDGERGALLRMCLDGLQRNADAILFMTRGFIEDDAR